MVLEVSFKANFLTPLDQGWDPGKIHIIILSSGTILSELLTSLKKIYIYELSLLSSVFHSVAILIQLCICKHSSLIFKLITMWRVNNMIRNSYHMLSCCLRFCQLLQN
jgi:hypothetical protein